MKIGIPKGLLYSKYHVFAKTFFEELGAEVVIPPDTNKEILDTGSKYCVDEACLSMKVFHGHAAWLKDRCDYLLAPRFISLERKKYICPMFCGTTEMLKNSIPGLPKLIDEPVYSLEEKELLKWALLTAEVITKNKKTVRMAFEKAMERQRSYKPGFHDEGYPFKILLLGHTYNIHDSFVNMNLKKKLNAFGIGVITEDFIEKNQIEAEVKKLFKQPFWYFARKFYGSAAYLYNENKVDGMIYISSFSCGVDSVVIELIKNKIEDFPFMVLKIDEHTGEAGFNTRIEAFSDMLKRRSFYESDVSADGKRIYSGKSAV